MTTDEPIYQTRPCAECHTPFDAPGAYVLERFIAWQHFCAACLPAVRAKKEQERADLARRQREAQWLEVCPGEFFTVDRRLLPDPDLFDRVQLWQFGSRGLVLAGETGLGKTRAAYALLYREFMAGRSVQIVTPYTLARWPYLVGNEPKQADTLIRRIVRADIFFADDALKSRLTPTVEELLFTALDERTSRKRPCFFTFNDSGATIMERLSTDRAKAFLRRIRDFTDVVKPSPATK